MAHDVSQYAIVQKEALGLDKCIETAKARMARYQVRAVRHAPHRLQFASHAPRPLRPQVTPNMLIVPPELLLYIATASEEKHVYNIAGPAGPEKFEGGVQGYEARAFRGCGVVTSSPFEISDDQDSLQMLQRNTQIGEFYRMRAPSIEFEADKKHAFYLDIVIYNEDSDMHTHISFEEALEASCLFEGKPDSHKEWGFTKAELIKNNKDGVWMPVSLVIARPFIEHRMMSAVLAVAGTDTGATLFGPADMQISANTSVKTIEGHYTCHTKSVITKPQNVMVLRDIMCARPALPPFSCVLGNSRRCARQVQRLRRRLQHDLLRLQQGDEELLGRRHPRPDQRAPHDGQRRRRRLPVDALLPGVVGRRDAARPGHLDLQPRPPVGHDERRHAHAVPGRRRGLEGGGRQGP